VKGENLKDLKLILLEWIKAEANDNEEASLSLNLHLNDFSNVQIHKTLKQLKSDNCFFGIEQSYFDSKIDKAIEFFEIYNLTIKGEEYLKVLKKDYEETTFNGWIGANWFRLIPIIISIGAFVISIISLVRR